MLRGEHNRNDQIGNEWISMGSDAIGVTIVATLGSTLGDSASVVARATAGALLSHALKVAGIEVLGKIISKGGKVRTERVILMAADEMGKRLRAGDEPRPDNFFAAQPPFCSLAEEIIESVLLKAEREPEERKLPYQAKLITYILFDSEVDVGMAHQLLRFAEALS